MKAVPLAVAIIPTCTVTRLTVDDSVTLAARSAEREVFIRMDRGGQMERQSRVERFDPDADPMSVCCLLSLLNARITDARIEEDGELRLQFGETTLRLPPDEHQVSWTVTTSDGARAVCIAEGRVIWQ